MMTKEELKSYIQKRGTGEAMSTWPVMPTTFSSVTFDDVKDALQIKYDCVSHLDDMATELIDGRGGTVVLFGDHAELYTNDPKFYASSNDNSNDGIKLKMLHDAFKAVPRQTGFPEDIYAFVKEELRYPLNDYWRNVLDELVDYLKSIGVKWVDELCSIVYPDQSNSKQADSDKVQPQSNAVLNASDGYIVIDTPVKIFRSQAAMESYRREHKEENTPALIVKDGEILCLQEEVK